MSATVFSTSNKYILLMRDQKLIPFSVIFSLYLLRLLVDQISQALSLLSVLQLAALLEYPLMAMADLANVLDP